MKILFDHSTIEKRIAELASRINADHQGQELVVICILKGAVVFFAELVKHLKSPVIFDFMATRSYGSKRHSSGKIKLVLKPEQKLKGRQVLVVEDIVDTGLTMAWVLKELKKQKPASLKVAALLDKPAARKVPVSVNYLGFRVPNRFIVGYGLDDNQKLRNLPYLATVED